MPVFPPPGTGEGLRGYPQGHGHGGGGETSQTSGTISYDIISKLYICTLSSFVSLRSWSLSRLGPIETIYNPQNRKLYFTCL